MAEKILHENDVHDKDDQSRVGPGATTPTTGSTAQSANGSSERDQLYEAVKHTLDQIQENPDVHYYCGWGTQIFYLLIRAEAAHLGKPLDEVETERRKDRQPSYRRRQAEVNMLRDKLQELRDQLDGGAR